MKRQISDYTIAAFTLIIAAAILLIIVVLSNRNDITSATLLLGGIGCFTVGILFLTFSRDEGIDTQIASLLSVQGTINTSQLIADLSVQGNAHFIPTEKGVMQYIPGGNEFHPPVITERYSYHQEEGGWGVLLTPNGAPFLTYLIKEHQLIIPDDEESIFELIKETFEDVLELANRVELDSSNGHIRVDLAGYRLFSECVAIQNISPKYCTMSPCPICSLIGCILAQGLKRYFTIKDVQVDEKDKSLHIIFSCL